MLAFLGTDVATVVVALVLFSICLGIIGRAAVRHRRGQAPGCSGCAGCAGCSGCTGFACGGACPPHTRSAQRDRPE